MELWLIYAIGAAVFAALTTILAKIGIKNVGSNLATAIRTMVVLAFAWIIVFIVGSHSEIGDATPRTWIFLILSGLATGGSWLCFFKALQLGDVNRVVPLKKSSTITTMLMAFIFLGEPLGVPMIVGMVLIAMGTWLMIKPKKAASSESEAVKSRHSWLFFAVLAAVFASLTAILGRIGIADIEANLGTAIRTVAVVPMSWIMVLITKEQKGITSIDRKSWVFLVLSGMATGASWLLFYHALQVGYASLVVPVDKLSIVATMAFARVVLGERFSKRSLIGLAILTLGTLLPVIF